MLESSPFLTQSLSLQAHQQKPLGALESLFDAENASLPLDQLLAQLMTRMSSADLIQRLAQSPDGLPLPEPLQWEPWDEAGMLSHFSPDERRLYHRFDQMVMNQRKGSKALLDYQNLISCYPEEENLVHAELTYRFLWEDRNSTQERARKVLHQHPDWLLVRLLLARSYLHEAHFDRHGFEASLNHRLLLHQHLPLKRPLTDLLVYQFHLDLYVYFALTGQLRRAAYAFKCCSEAASSEALLPLAPLILATLKDGAEDPAFAALVKFLRP